MACQHLSSIADDARGQIDTRMALNLVPSRSLAKSLAEEETVRCCRKGALMSDCAPVAEGPVEHWQFIGGYPNADHLVGNTQARVIVYVWAGEFPIDYQCNCGAEAITVTVWGNYHYIREERFSEFAYTLDPRGAPFAEHFERVSSAGGGRFDPSKWWRAATSEDYETEVENSAPERPDRDEYWTTYRTLPPVVDCETRQVTLPDGTVHEFDEFLPSSSSSGQEETQPPREPIPTFPPPPPWPQMYDRCCSALPLVDLPPKIEVDRNLTRVYQDDNVWWFDAEIVVTHPCGVNSVWVSDFIYYYGKPKPVAPPLRPARGTQTISQDEKTVTVSYRRQNVNPDERAVLLVVRAVSKCRVPVIHASIEIRATSD